MTKSTRKIRLADRSGAFGPGAWLCFAMLLSQASAFPFSHSRIGEDAVIKLYVTIQREDYSMPWQTSPPGRGMGSGFYIGRRRILTNAHVVSDARFLQVQKHGDPGRFAARVTFIAHDCDLATLTVDDTAFYKGLRPMDFAGALPRLNDEVTVAGYPMGGVRLSVTRGVVSRIDYSAYSHSGVDQHLVLQVDAAINPGNSGGPILLGGKVVGLAFQGISWADNIGYGIPLPVIRHFIDDIEDGAYDGYPELGVTFLDTRNPALRNDLGMTPPMTGAVIYRVDPFGSGRALLRARDVLTAIDGYAIANDGTILIDGNTMVFPEVLERKQWGQTVRLEVWREGRSMNIEIPLTNPPDPFIYRNLYDQRPDYYMLGGLVFSPLTRPFLQTIAAQMGEPNAHALLYHSQYAKLDGLFADRDEFVVLIRRLPHPVNTYTEAFLNGIVTSVNGRHIRNLRELKNAMTAPRDGFHVIRFAGQDDSLVLDAAAATAAQPQILKAYGVSTPEHFTESE